MPEPRYETRILTRPEDGGDVDIMEFDDRDRAIKAVNEVFDTFRHVEAVEVWCITGGITGEVRRRIYQRSVPWS